LSGFPAKLRIHPCYAIERGTFRGVAAQNEDEMSKIRSQYKTMFLTVVAAIAMAACSEDVTTGLDRAAPASPDVVDARVDLGPCDSLAVPAGFTLAARTFAKGVQIYRWSGSAWVFDAPEAVLSADEEGMSVIGTHFRGPTWKSNAGSEVSGTVAKRCVPNASSIAWLLLTGRDATGPGIFERVTHIQRINTKGGIAPTYAGNFVGEEARVAYSTVYLFYRAE
jgi:hypothetical protein